MIKKKCAGVNKNFLSAARPEAGSLCCEWNRSPGQPPRRGCRNRRNSHEGLQGRVCFGRAQGFPIVVGAPMLEVREISVLGREQPMLLGLSLHPRSGEL